MAKLSVVIPSRDERFLIPTIDDIFRQGRGDLEVVAVLDSDKWPDNWAEVVKRHAPRLHTIHNGSPIGMRASVNKGVGSAISRGATYIAKSDGHCAFSEGFDEILKAEMDDDWVVIPRRLRLDPESWTIAEPDKPPYDYHYLSFPDNPNDFGGPGLNGKPWVERQRERADILIDEEMSSQGSFWAMKADYFTKLELMDEASYGPFWNEFQEIGLKCWLSGGKVMVNKKCWYAHLHKGKKYGRGYRLEESALTTGRNHTMKWIWNEAWAKQTLPFEWLIDHFWPMPGWPENWREVLYATRKPRQVGMGGDSAAVSAVHGDSSGSEVAEKQHGQGVKADEYAGEKSPNPAVAATTGLFIRFAWYGYGSIPDGKAMDVTTRVRELVKDDSLDIIVNNSTLTPGQNPYRGKKKKLWVAYNYDGGPQQDVMRDEKEWLIIGEPQRRIGSRETAEFIRDREGREKHVQPAEAMRRFIDVVDQTTPEARAYIADERSYPMSPAALNDYLIRKFSISPQRLRAPMPIELRGFHRNDLAQVFAELGFRKGCEVGVAEGHYSEVLLQANPDLDLLMVDPWEGYSGNPQNKTKDKHDFAFTETVRRTGKYPNAKPTIGTSMNTVDTVAEQSLDFCYIDGNHLFDYVMQDLIEWSKRVRSGGIVSGDDYYALDQKRWVGGGVVEAVQAYVNAHRIPIWFTCSGHKSYDYFWVKP